MGQKIPCLFLGLASWFVLGAASVATAAITIATVPVGNPGNAGDPLSGGFGTVNYAYNIGKYEVTSGQYTAFLNAVAKTDTFGLYNPSMTDPNLTAISRSGVSGGYIYNVAAATANRPIAYVTFWDACRFANWLQNGQPSGAQGVGTTETGAYTMTANGVANNTITRNTGSTWAVTSENEWYKAAYYNPGTSTYFLYPTRSNSQPGFNPLDPAGNSAGRSIPWAVARLLVRSSAALMRTTMPLATTSIPWSLMSRITATVNLHSFPGSRWAFTRARSRQ